MRKPKENCLGCYEKFSVRIQGQREWITQDLVAIAGGAYLFGTSHRSLEQNVVRVEKLQGVIHKNRWEGGVDIACQNMESLWMRACEKRGKNVDILGGKHRSIVGNAARGKLKDLWKSPLELAHFQKEEPEARESEQFESLTLMRLRKKELTCNFNLSTGLLRGQINSRRNNRPGLKSQVYTTARTWP